MIFDVNTKSWHYRLASKYPEMRPGDDICAYSRSVLRGLIVACFIVIAISAVLAMLIDTLLFLYFIITGPLIQPHELAIAFMAIMAVIAYIFGSSMLDEWEHRRARAVKDHISSPSFITQAYNSWKEKYCVKLTFDGESSPE